LAFAYVYMMASYKNGTIYTGVTRDLGARVTQHKINYNPNAFTAEFKVHRLIYWEEFDLIAEAIHREKRLKKYKRQWKINLIEKENPNWRDLDPGTGSYL